MDATRLRAALFLMSLSVILWEILLTRIYSVTLFYHFAFMAVSLAMFGLTAGAVLVFLDRRSGGQPLAQRLAQLAILTGILMVACIVLQLTAPLARHPGGGLAWHLFRTCFLSAIPFIPAGAFICIALTRFGEVGALYAWDLAGAGVGCLVIPLLLSALGGPGAILVAGALALGAAAALAPRGGARTLPLGLSLVVLCFVVLNSQSNWFRVRWQSDGPTPAALHESWNAFSRVIVSAATSEPIAYGVHPEIRAKLPPVEQLFLQIDSGAGTPITRFRGDLRELEFLRLDVASLAYHLAPPGEVAIIGPGGGRDVLMALSFGQKSIDAVEVNGNIVAALNKTFGEFSGHLDRMPGLRFIVDDGRSYIEHGNRRYDVIQASLVDTVAATAAGAYAFTENGLYTREAWQSYLRHLAPRGILTFSRWYLGVAPWPVELYRTSVLAAAALRAEGIAEPERHILIAATRPHDESPTERLATILVSRSPFEVADLRKLQTICAGLRCDVVFSSVGGTDALLRDLILGKAPLDQFPLDVSAPTDDRPFFFFHALPSRLFTAEPGAGYSQFNSPAIRILAFLMVGSILLGAGLVLVPPLWLAAQGAWAGTASSHAVATPLYFAGIGAAFMFVEIALIQRLSLYLGHPTYGFTVVLFGLLFFTAMGSAFYQGRKAIYTRPWRLFALLAVLLACCEAVSAWLLGSQAGASAAARILLALAVMLPPAFLMGAAFPLGMDRVQQAGDPRAAWYWAINGALSVIAAVAAMVTSFCWGISTTFWIGIGLYLVAGLLSRRIHGDAPAALWHPVPRIDRSGGQGYA
jgi:hypothetical protein